MVKEKNPIPPTHWPSQRVSWHIGWHTTYTLLICLLTLPMRQPTHRQGFSRHTTDASADTPPTPSADMLVGSDSLPLRLVSIWSQTIADRRSQIAESSAIICDHMETHFCDCLRSCDCDHRRLQKTEPCSIFCDRLRSCDHMETKVLQSAIETYPIIFLILTDDSTPLSHKARMFVYSNAHLLLTWLALNIVARYECVYNRNSKNFKDKHKKSDSWEKIGEKFNWIF